MFPHSVKPKDLRRVHNLIGQLSAGMQFASGSFLGVHELELRNISLGMQLLEATISLFIYSGLSCQQTSTKGPTPSQWFKEFLLLPGAPSVGLYWSC